MAELLNAIRTTAGEVFEKKEDSAGRTYYVQKGKGRVDPEAYSGANQSLSHVVTDDDGKMPRNIREADTAAELEAETGIPFTDDFFGSFDHTSKDSALKAEGNRFQGFWAKNDHLDRDEAAKEYIEFRNELQNAPNAQARGIVKSSYNIGGS